MRKSDQKNITLLSQGDVLSDVKEWISTGFRTLDKILGGGWAVGRASELFGIEGTGKSALTHMAVKECQKNGGVVVYIDFENALDKQKMSQLGIDPDKLIYCSPEHIQEAWDMVWEAIDYMKANPPKAPSLIVWDSVAASIPKDELEADSAEDNQMALIARAMAKGCRRMYRQIAKVRAHMLWVNHESTKFGSRTFIPEITTPGGREIKFAASLRIRCTIRERLKRGDVATGYLIQCNTYKCRLVPPHQKANWVLDFTHGPSPELTMFQALLDGKYIKSSGGGFYIGTWSKKQFTRESWLQRLADDAEFAAAADMEYAKGVDNGRITVTSGKFAGTSGKFAGKLDDASGDDA